MHTSHTICSLCKSPHSVSPYESYLPLCADCKALLFHGNRENTISYLEDELTVLRPLSSHSLLIASWQLYDIRHLQQLYSNNDNDAKLNELTAEADKIYYGIGRAVLPVLFHQLALYFFNTGWLEDAITLFMDTIGGLNCSYLLYGQPEGLLQPHLAACYNHLGMVYEVMGDARQAWAVKNASLHLRNQVSECLKHINALEKFL